MRTAGSDAVYRHLVGRQPPLTLVAQLPHGADVRVRSLTIENFRAISHASLHDLGDMVLIAGPNGCGKSCILDGLRLLKSTYGGYQRNEWRQWFNDSAINLSRRGEDVQAVMQDRSRKLRIEAEFSFSDRELAYLSDNAGSLVTDLTWQAVVPGQDDPFLAFRANLARDRRAHQQEVDEKAAVALEDFKERLQSATHRASVIIEPDGNVLYEPNTLLETAFSFYLPKQVGVMDYHGPHRSYKREEVGSINLRLDQSNDRNAKHALYQSENKYSNIKSEMAAAYVKAILSAKASGTEAAESELILTMRELFRTFFPGKHFVGPTPDAAGSLSFPVQLSNGAVHDIDQLSSGEKEVLFGYLRLRNAAPVDSIILFDEPELHLNPRLVKGLPDFYNRHLGKELNNQIWLVTHSDAFLRDAIGLPGVSVWHMQPSIVEPDQQLTAVAAEDELERVIIDLVGDLAVYRPGGKVVIFEGENSEFDIRVVNALFPELESAVNVISAGGKTRVKRLHELLEATTKKAGLAVKFYSVVDRDGDYQLGGSERALAWDAYHIENYLLSPAHILGVLEDLRANCSPLDTVQGVETRLRELARTTIPWMVKDEIARHVNSEVQAVNARLKADPGSGSLASQFATNLDMVSADLSALRSKGELRDSRLKLLERKASQRLSESLGDGSWTREFRGRDILRKLSLEVPVGYSPLVDLILARMRADGYRPPGMKAVVDQILAG